MRCATKASWDLPNFALLVALKDTLFFELSNERFCHLNFSWCGSIGCDRWCDAEISGRPATKRWLYCRC